METIFFYGITTLLLGVYLYIMGVLMMTIVHFSAMLFGAPYVSAKDSNIEKMKNLTPNRGNIVDLGSGDGRLLIELAKKSEKADGYEISPLLVWLSKRKIRQAGQEKKIRIYWKNFWRYDLGEYDTVYIYGISYIMVRLEQKLQKELSSGAEVVTCGFHFPEWKPIEKDGPVWLYQKK